MTERGSKATRLVPDRVRAPETTLLADRRLRSFAYASTGSASTLLSNTMRPPFSRTCTVSPGA